MASPDSPRMVGASVTRVRLCIFVVTYFAEATLEQVLDRIPRELFALYDAEILIVDDASRDRTRAVAEEYLRSHPELRVTLLQNPRNLGYGGSQKVGYAFAIERGFDVVALLHGDAQYAPEDLPRLVGPVASGEVDAVFGSRMMDRFAALRGGMPTYKFIGNRILTGIENTLLGTRMSEFHSGYRVYSIEALRALPLALNSDEFHFDTEIIIQLLNASRRIRELPIATHYGDEVCRVNGLKYAANVVLAVAKNAAHRSGLFYQARFDSAPRRLVRTQLP